MASRLESLDWIQLPGFQRRRARADKSTEWASGLVLEVHGCAGTSLLVRMLCSHQVPYQLGSAQVTRFLVPVYSRSVLDWSDIEQYRDEKSV